MATPEQFPKDVLGSQKEKNIYTNPNPVICKHPKSLSRGEDLTHVRIIVFPNKYTYACSFCTKFIFFLHSSKWY